MTALLLAHFECTVPKIRKNSSRLEESREGRSANKNSLLNSEKKSTGGKTKVDSGPPMRRFSDFFTLDEIALEMREIRA